MPRTSERRIDWHAGVFKSVSPHFGEGWYFETIDRNGDADADRCPGNEVVESVEQAMGGH